MYKRMFSCVEIDAGGSVTTVIAFFKVLCSTMGRIGIEKN